MGAALFLLAALAAGHECAVPPQGACDRGAGGSAPGPAPAEVPVEALAANADQIFRGTVTASRSSAIATEASGATEVTVAVQEFFKSRTFLPRLTLALRGDDAPSLIVGEQVLLFVTDREPDGPAIVGGWQGLYYRRGPTAVQAVSGKAVPLRDLKARIRSVVKVPPPAYGGALLVHGSVEELAREADGIVVAAVDDVRARFTANLESIETEVTLRVEQTLKGPTGSTLTLVLPGGAVGDLQLLVGGVPNFWVGERVLLFVSATVSHRSVTGLWQGKFSLANGLAIQPETGKALSPAVLESRIARALTTPAGPREDDGPVAVEPRFATFCVPWTPSQVPVPHFINPARPGPGAPAGPAFVKLMQQSLQVWQDVPDAWFSARIAGATTRAATNHFDGKHDVAWGDLDAFGTRVLAVNFCAIRSGVRIDSDTQLDNTGFTWSTDAAPGTIDLDSVARHEFGHGAGLGHTFAGCDSGPNTPLMCPTMGDGVEKGLQADDTSGLLTLYPLAGAPPPTPSGLTAELLGLDAVLLRWTNVAGGLGSEIQRASGGCRGPFVGINSVAADTTVYTDDEFGAGLPEGLYCYRIKALGQGGDSDASTTATLRIGPFRGGVLVATGNLDGLGADEIITGAGPGGGPRVRAFSADGASRATNFFAYPAGFTGGVRVAACDFDGDRRAEIVTGAGPGGGPHVRVIKLDAAGQPAGDLASFFAYDSDFRGGVFVGCGDVDGDGTPDLITGADAGGGPHVRVFRIGPGGPRPLLDFFAYEPGFPGGVRVAAGNVGGAAGAPHVRVVKFNGRALEETASFLAYSPNFIGGIFVAAGNVTGDAHAEIVTGADAGGGPHVRVFSGAGADTGIGFFAYAPVFTGGVRVAVGYLEDGAGLGTILTAAGPGGGPHVQGFTRSGAPTAASFFAY